MVQESVSRRVLIACTVCLALPTIAWSQDFYDPATREVNSYQLVEAALAKYAAATRGLAPLIAEHPHECDEEESGESLSELAAQLDAVPGAPAALKAAGMSSREYVVFMLASFQAGMGAWALTDGGGELPPGVSPENVAFYQNHEVELQDLAALMPRDRCDDDEYDDEEYGDDERQWDDSDDYDSDG